jgi:ACS family glucarate transporter-like MFS transporter
MKHRNRVLGLLASLSVLTYVDRVCISVAGPRLQGDLHLSPQDWGLVSGAFAIAYMLFEIPSGHLADRFGARLMVTRIVLWWSAFTALTGLASALWPLVVIRFLFGVGEAGAYPTASTSVFRWFPEVERGRAFGVVFLSSQLGGALAPLFIVPIQMHFGWRVSFYVCGIVGVIWTAVWWLAYRNRPAEMPGISDAEVAEIGAEGESVVHEFPWKALAASRQVWAIMGSACSYLYSYYFFLFWLPTYMVRSRGFTESETKLSALPFILAAAASLAGGFARDYAVGRWGQTRGPRFVCQLGLSTSALSAIAAVSCAEKHWALAFLGLCFAGITFQQPTVFSACVDIGKRYAGAVVGCMNSAAALGGLLSSAIFGYLVQRFGNYEAVLYSMAGALLTGAALWFMIDAARPLRVEAS